MPTIIRKTLPRTELILAIIALLTSAVESCAQTTGAAFLQNEGSPVGYALGRSDVVTSLGASAVGSNAANLGMMGKKYEFSAAYANLMDGMNYGHISAAMSLNSSAYLPLTGLGLSVTRVAVGGISGADANGNPNGSFSNEDLALALGGSARVTRNLGVGVTGKVIKSSLAGYQSNAAIAGDFGLSYAPSRFRGTLLGVGINNVGQGQKFLDQTAPLPMTANAGLSVPVGSAMGVLSVTRHIHENRTEMGIGMGIGVGPVEFRGGYLAQGGEVKNLAANDQSGIAQMMGGISGGFGIQMGSMRVDYAISQGAAELGTNQRVQLSMGWGDKQAVSTEPMKKGTRVIQSPWRSNNNQDSIDWQLIR